MAHDWKRIRTKRLGMLIYIVRKIKLTRSKSSLRNSPKMKSLHIGQGLIAIESDPGAIYKDISENYNTVVSY